MPTVITGIETEVRITRGRAMERAIANASYMTSQRHRSKRERREAGRVYFHDVIRLEVPEGVG